jgi:hypothetical protein
MNFNNDNEVLDFFYRLLDMLHQADLQNFGSHIQLVYVAPGAQHVDHIQTQYFGERHSAALHPVPQKHSELPEALTTPQAMLLWQKAQQAGYVDEHYQPLLSRTQAALLADAMAERLGIKEKWKVFESFWHRKNMYKDYYDALNQKQSLVFQDSMKVVLS